MSPMGDCSAQVGGAASGVQHYTAFGEVRSRGGEMPTAYQYTRQLSQMEQVGLYHYGARWFDPAGAHFTQADTLIPELYNPLDWDRYAYGRGNPLKYTDPTGHMVACDKDDWACQTHWDEPITPPNEDKYTFDTGLSENQVETIVKTAEIIFPIFIEPVDWMQIYDACSLGDCSPLLLLGFLPIIPGSVGNKIGNKLDDAIRLVPKPRGGVYTLTNPLGKVVRVGHTKDLISRAGNYRRDRNYFDLIFNVIYRTDDYATRRGLEQMLYDLYIPMLNTNRPIRIGNPNIAHYLDAATNYLNNLSGLK